MSTLYLIAENTISQKKKKPQTKTKKPKTTQHFATQETLFKHCHAQTLFLLICFLLITKYIAEKLTLLLMNFWQTFLRISLSFRQEAVYRISIILSSHCLLEQCFQKYCSYV